MILTGSDRPSPLTNQAWLQVLLPLRKTKFALKNKFGLVRDGAAPLALRPKVSAITNPTTLSIRKYCLQPCPFAL
ncbi:hypothetical protein H6F86_20070 [Phormidium sp. FACHB-592]|uniref:Uncharacterized protein n=1 Tax=Stenomitos frigidus AS-A4 TaxID=2933935 RepID=A0ABV0KE70_9CYAN|nr:hypothetical protein [Phormidium sp. FACHB-592]MBD2076127.1 hypothetical protein [Phormidium sp. FACHB-592]